MLRVLLLAAFACLSSAPVTAQPTGRIEGAVVDAATQLGLPGATVTVVGTGVGAAADADGRFVLPAVPIGTQALDVRFVGYGPVIRPDVVVRPGRTAEVQVALRETLIEGEGVTVSAGYFDAVERVAPVSAVAFSSEEVRRAPGAGGEISRVLSALPGVAARGENSQDLFVRGGAPSENGFYIDNIPIPVPQHFATPDGSSNGPTGLINNEFVDKVAFARGAFSASYGGRLSSIVDIRYRDGATDRVRGKAGINFAGGLLVAEGPIPGGSVFASARRSYLDVVAGAIDAGGAPVFGDAQLKVSFDVAPGQRLTLLTLYGQSEFSETELDAAENGEGEFGTFVNEQNTAGLNWRALWGGRAVSNTSVSTSFYQQDNEVDFLRGLGGRATEDVLDRYGQVRHVTRASLAPGLDVEAGAEGAVERQTYQVRRDAYVGLNGDAQPAIARDLSLDRARAGAFATAEWRVARVTAGLGVRADWDDLSETVYAQPRLSLGLGLTDRLTARAAYGVFRQPAPLSLIAQAEGNRGLSQVRADHVVLGLDLLVRPDVLVTVEAFDKQYRDAPQLAPGSPIGLPIYPLDARGEFVGALVSDGEASAQGIEVLAQKKMAGGLYGLVSGSYFRSRYRDAAGVQRDRDYDARTQVSAVGGWKPNARWEASVRWSYLGGRPYTPVDAAASAAADGEVRDVARTNGERLPAYHSLFLRVDRRFNFRAANLVASLSLWNAYSRANVEDRFWNFVESRVDDSTLFSLLPIAGLELEVSTGPAHAGRLEALDTGGGSGWDWPAARHDEDDVEEERWRGPPPAAYALVGIALLTLVPMVLALLLASP